MTFANKGDETYLWQFQENNVNVLEGPSVTQIFLKCQIYDFIVGMNIDLSCFKNISEDTSGKVTNLTQGFDDIHFYTTFKN